MTVPPPSPSSLMAVGMATFFFSFKKSYFSLMAGPSLPSKWHGHKKKNIAASQTNSTNKIQGEIYPKYINHIQGD